MNRKIEGAVLTRARIFKAGDEEALAAVLPQSDMDRLVANGTLTGEWTAAAPVTPADAGGANADTTEETDDNHADSTDASTDADDSEHADESDAGAADGESDTDGTDDTGAADTSTTDAGTNQVNGTQSTRRTQRSQRRK